MKHKKKYGLFYHTKYFQLVLITVFVSNLILTDGFLPKRTARWWDNQITSLGHPISAKEKKLSMTLQPLSIKSPYSYKYLESQRLFEGDIYMPANFKMPEINQNRRNILRGLHAWPNAEIPYTIEDTFDTVERLHIARAMTEIESQTCIRFVPRSPLGINFVYIQKGKDCASNVGRIGGGQPLSLAPRCIQYGIILHELLHALGFWHEQSRYDRRNYVNIHWFNIKPLMLPNFFISPYYIMSDVGLPYDYESIMHYSPYTFARNTEKPTITAKNDGAESIIGQRQGLSKLNVEGLNILYDCENSKYNGIETAGSTYEHARELGDTDSCMDLWIFCFPLRLTATCWWGDYMMRRYCRRTCGLC